MALACDKQITCRHTARQRERKNRPWRHQHVIHGLLQQVSDFFVFITRLIPLWPFRTASHWCVCMCAASFIHSFVVLLFMCFIFGKYIRVGYCVCVFLSFLKTSFFHKQWIAVESILVCWLYIECSELNY